MQKVIKLELYLEVDQDISNEDLEEYVQFELGSCSASGDNPCFERDNVPEFHDVQVVR